MSSRDQAKEWINMQKWDNENAERALPLNWKMTSTLRKDLQVNAMPSPPPSILNPNHPMLVQAHPKHHRNPLANMIRNIAQHFSSRDDHRSALESCHLAGEQLQSMSLIALGGVETCGQPSKLHVSHLLQVWNKNLSRFLVPTKRGLARIIDILGFHLRKWTMDQILARGVSFTHIERAPRIYRRLRSVRKPVLDGRGLFLRWITGILGRWPSSTARCSILSLLWYCTDWIDSCFPSCAFVSSAHRKKNVVDRTYIEGVLTGKPSQGQTSCGKDGSGNFVVVIVAQSHITLHNIIQCLQSRACVTNGDVGNESKSRELWSGPHLMPKTMN